MNQNILYTAGYEGENIQQFVLKLLTNQVELVVDVREIPLSRKRGFSKSQLKSILNDYKINYVHYKQLGSPRDIRHKLHSDGNYNEFFKCYKEYINSQEEVLQELKEVVTQENTCLMCFENNPHLCHRSVVAGTLSNILDNRIKVVDI